MSELRGSRARRPMPLPTAPSRPAPPPAPPVPAPVDGTPGDGTPGRGGAGRGDAAPGDLQTVFTELARRSRLPTGPEARPSEVLRSAGLPLLMAALVAGGQATAGLPARMDARVDGGPAPTSQPSGAGGWTVTTPTAQAPTAPPPDAPPAPTNRPAQTAPRAPATRTPPAPAAPAARTAPPPTPRPAPARTSAAPADPAPTSRATAPKSRAAAPTSRATAKSGTPRPPVRRATRTPSSGAATPPAGPRQGPVTPSRPAPAVSERTAEGPGAPSDGGERTYVVRSGDSLIAISRRERVKLHDLLEVNRLHLESVIRPGDTLRLPPDPNRPGATRTYPPDVTAAADANRRALARGKVPTREQVQAMVASTARAMGVDPALALGIAYLESGFQQRLVSPANALGVMQVTPAAGRWASRSLGVPLDLMDAPDNITAGIALLRALTQAADTEAQAVAGYYQGLASVQQNGMFDDTRRYVATVLTLRSRFAAGR